MLVAAGAFKWVCGSACLVRLLCCSHFWARNKELEGKRRRKDSSRSADDDSFFIHFEFLFVPSFSSQQVAQASKLASARSHDRSQLLTRRVLFYYY